MCRRALWGLALLAGTACWSDSGMSPTEAGLPDQPSFTISDGAHGAGNPDFFFVPPMVPNPSGDADYTPAGFNSTLSPTVVICALNVANNAPESAITAATTCRPTQPTGFPVTFSGSQIGVSIPMELY